MRRVCGTAAQESLGQKPPSPVQRCGGAIPLSPKLRSAAAAAAADPRPRLAADAISSRRASPSAARELSPMFNLAHQTSRQQGVHIAMAAQTPLLSQQAERDAPKGALHADSSANRAERARSDDTDSVNCSKKRAASVRFTLRADAERQPAAATEDSAAQHGGTAGSGRFTLEDIHRWDPTSQMLSVFPCDWV